jgi:hypothetical protein
MFLGGRFILLLLNREGDGEAVGVISISIHGIETIKAQTSHEE